MRDDLVYRLSRHADALDARDDGHTIALLNSAATQILRLTEQVAAARHDRDQAIRLANDWLDRANRWRTIAEHLAAERQKQ